MAIPATTGVLRTKISDMVIGDYIVCNYQAASGAVGTFSNFGGIAGAELPVVASATPNGTFYFIKVDKGLLFADRNIQASVSWETLNTGKAIQGLPWDAGTITTGGTADASPNPQYANLVFDANLGSGYDTGSATTGWVSYQFSSPVIIRRYSIYTSNANNAPKDWTFEGWDGSAWVVLDRQTGQIGWTSNKRYYSIASPKSYIKYRVNVTANNGGTSLYIYEIGMMDTAGIIRSLTGGICYVNANGGVGSSTDANLGCFPTNNEWDTYIVKSNLKGKITAGDNAVWNWNAGPGTWVQDTTYIGTLASTNRNVRGRDYGNAYKVNGFNAWLTNTASTGVGFRPVFEYNE